jgi:DNA invertase Pin-like site-specific DNA recombinase
MDDKTLCWLAGLFEGEASFLAGTPSRPHHPLIALTMTDEEIVARVAQLFSHAYTHIPPKKSSWKASYKFTIRSSPAAKLMKQLYPIMGIRRQRQITHALSDYIEKENPAVTFQKLNEAQVRQIKIRLARHETAKSIAKDFGVTHYTIWAISEGKTWKHVQLTGETLGNENDNDAPNLLLNSVENQFHWLAGLLEAEGSFMVGSPSSPNAPRISLPMTDEDVIARAAEICDVKYQSLNSRNPNHKDVFRVYIKGKRAVELMKQLKLFMGQRRQAQIEKVLNSYVEYAPRKGSANHNAKISEEQARAIKRRAFSGEAISQIASDFGVSVSIVREIKYGRAWKHVEI